MNAENYNKVVILLLIFMLLIYVFVKDVLTTPLPLYEIIVEGILAIGFFIWIYKSL